MNCAFIVCFLCCYYSFNILFTRQCISLESLPFLVLFQFLLDTRYPFCHVQFVFIPIVQKSHHTNGTTDGVVDPIRSAVCIWRLTRCANKTPSCINEKSPSNSNPHKNSLSFVPLLYKHNLAFVLISTS